MTPQPLEALQRSLERELSWRSDEITELCTVISEGGAQAYPLFRAGLVMLSAHWEGFLKKSVSLYLDHVFAQRLPLDQLSPPMVAVAFFNDVKHAATSNYPGSDLHHVSLARRIQQGLHTICEKPGWTVATQGNPGTDLLERILASVGLDKRLGMDEPAWAATGKFINDHVLRDRHQVAHGEGLRLTQDEILARATRLLDLLATLRLTIIEAAGAERYRKAA
ncbi:MAG: hypothetical protein EON56_03340 [Alphaproteobacteria bacterium]|nr:MAG: hypothetical protein EON56_03340 [Alphaproteobacteria bacterium]